MRPAVLAALALAAVSAAPAAPGSSSPVSSSAVSSPAVQRAPAEAPYVPGEILVKFRREASATSRGVLRVEMAGATRQRFASGAELWRLGDGLAVPEAIARLKAAPEIEYAEPNYLLHAARLPDDPLFPQQYSLLNTGQEDGEAGADIDAAAAWDISTGGSSALVAIIDSGIDLDHPDLAANLWTNPDEIPGNLVDDDGNGLVDDVHGWDFLNQDNDPDDDDGHGTHVAGIIGAAGDNGLGIAGIAWRASLMPLKFLDEGGFGATSDAIRAIDYAVAHEARVLNASWGGGGFSIALLESIRAAGAHQALFVAAAGNDAADLDEAPFYPAGYDLPGMVAVAATDRHDHLAPFSNFGRTSVDLAAPGVAILSTLPGGRYGPGSGTSMATPHVSGVAALILGLAPGMGVEPLRRRLLDHAEPVAALADTIAGAARLNAVRCLLDADTVAPGPLVDLRVIEPLSDGLVLGWVATGDDLDRGAAVAYDVRLSDAPFDAAGFEAAARRSLPGSPLFPGAPETQEIGGLEPSRAYHVGIRAVDEWGNAGPPSFATATTRPAPVLELTPDVEPVTLRSGHTTGRVVTIRNDSDGTLDWSVPRPILRPTRPPAAPRPERWGGPDPSGYVFIDSDEPDGPVFAWRDIGAAGRSALIAGDDRISAPIPIGFSFPFYGETFTSVQIASNGFLTFTPAAATHDNQPLPSPGAPGHLIAGFWDDLLVPQAADLLWLSEPHAFTVQFDGVMRVNGGGPYTFQIILFDTGEIQFQYLEMTGLAFSETVGLQDGSRSAGLSIAYNVPYVHDRLAVRLFAPKGWLTATPASGRLRSGESQPVALAFDASGLGAGTYEGLLPILSNDPDRPRVEIPLRLSVEDARAIATEPAAVDFGSIIAAQGARFGLTIVNSGSLPLTVTAAVPSDAGVVAGFAPFGLAPGGRRGLTLVWLPAGPGLLQASLRIESDAQNAPSLTVPLTGIALNMPPRAAAIWPSDQVECSGPGGSEVVLDASPSEDDDGGPAGIVLYEWMENPGTAAEAPLGTGVRIARTLPPGAHRLALRVTDNRGATDVVERTITVADTIPPELRVKPAPAILWPPTHRMVPVRLTLSARDTCSNGVTVRLIEVTSSEPDDAEGRDDGQTVGDIAGVEAETSDTGILLRAERNVTGAGRLYTIRYVATDAAGHDTAVEAFVTVPALRRGERRR